MITPLLFECEECVCDAFIDAAVESARERERENEKQKQI